MKLSEYPKSIFNTLKLRSKKIQKLQEADKDALPVIVSLTSIPSRLNKVAITIRSLMAQEPKPKNIILWLNEGLKTKIPKRLRALEGGIFEIRYSPYTFSHRKLIHTLEAYPNEVVVTFDDDMIYHKDTLKLLYDTHIKYPNNVVAHRTRIISEDDAGVVLPYKNWRHINSKDVFSTKRVMPVGACGVLYPPYTLDKRIAEVELFNKLAPKADDIWFKAMSFLKGTISRPTEQSAVEPIPIIGSQAVSLKKVNVKEDFNRTQWLQVSEYFGIELKE